MLYRLKRLTRRFRARAFPELVFEDFRQERINTWMETAPTLGATLFLGDSHIERGLWSEWWGDGSFLNRGIGHDTIESVRGRLEEVVRHQPKLIVLQCGTNNIISRPDVLKSSQQYKELLQNISSRLPETSVAVQSIYPVHALMYGEETLAKATALALQYNAHVEEMNSALQKMISAPNHAFVDVNPALTKDGALNPAYTLDGLHLNGVGYKVLRAALYEATRADFSELLRKPRS